MMKQYDRIANQTIRNEIFRVAKAGICCGLLVSFISTAGPVFGQKPRLEVATGILDGDAPGIKVTGLSEKSEATLHVVRRLSRYETDDSGNWQQAFKVLHAWATFSANEKGEIAADSFTPIAGTYSSPDSLALLRTGYLLGDPNLKEVRAVDASEFADLKADEVAVLVEQEGQITASKTFRLISDRGNLDFQTVAEAGVHGIFARPKEGPDLPIVISLHGSEGGSMQKARQRAEQFASRGFATLALNYFAYPHEGIEGVATAHIETPIEMIETARDWLAKQKDLDMKKLSLYGSSKGAEFALVAATKYDWINSVVAVVPGDAVWAGYGDDELKEQQKSSWSFEGKPLPFIPLFSFDPNQKGLYRTNTERYSRSRQFYSAEVPASLIPIEKTSAKLLLLASDRDEVWESGNMARNLAERMMDSGKGDQVEVVIFPRAGHQMVGVGTFPIRLYGTDSSDPFAKDINAEGAAAAESWKRTIEFLSR